jgi:adenosine deaminase
VRYLELRFAPVALGKAEGFPLGEVMDWVVDSAHKSAREEGINVSLVASVNRHESLELAEEVVKLAVDRKGEGIVGIDLTGSEATAKATPFIGLFNEAREAGMQITIHAGEWRGPDNVYEAITKFKSKRIGHGVRVMEDQKVVALARERGTTFEVCITSNCHSGAVPSLRAHPFARMIFAGLNVTLNSDDPSISRIELSDEYRLANEELGVALSTLRERTLAAAGAAFLPQDERVKLVEALKNEYEVLLPND